MLLGPGCGLSFGTTLGQPCTKECLLSPLLNTWAVIRAFTLLRCCGKFACLTLNPGHFQSLFPKFLNRKSLFCRILHVERTTILNPVFAVGPSAMFNIAEPLTSFIDTSETSWMPVLLHSLCVSRSAVEMSRPKMGKLLIFVGPSNRMGFHACQSQTMSISWLVYPSCWMVRDGHQSNTGSLIFTVLVTILHESRFLIMSHAL